ncbi:hypothetical protein [Flavobacterium sp. B183]|uniref:hypothetical protein n=1 Tax=Flavobacterium sp. B183 TaxID=907046 RepID=UPI00201E8AD5|nr:hypothetical protein [Flavobacterium sp. B183]URC13581.1 hypothetical protein M4I44_04070 [Flavobacterium sp. B183]
MKPQYLLLLSFVIACQKPKSESQIISINPENKVENTIPAKEKFLKTDTITLNDEGETPANKYILAHLISQKADKDSIVTGNYHLDFYQNKTKTVSSRISIKGIEKGSEWGASLGLTSSTTKNSPFIHISFGYPACGYNQNNYLYYLKNKTVQLVHEWSSMSDSGWGGWVEFVNPSAKVNPDSFYCKTVFFEPDDNDENMGTVKYSDSMVFRLIGNQWKKQLLTKEDQTYFEKKMSFDDFHSQK